ncbi:uncharacterized protein LOC131434051 [Malaya genurostris]|uniref:uncharacterized protein LOC131434051 n=1 Tax=Malaya genurostris TaxID=325434 RepID=UPI0026F3A72E|nr:uncharacterized protein LOC131434051 [Malaya genurostris]
MLLAQGGLELQEIFFNIPGADVEGDEENGIDPFAVAVEKLDEYFAPQRHEAHERYVFWGTKPEPGESLVKFLMRARTFAERCNLGKTSAESTSIAVVDKMLQFVPTALREKMLQEKSITLDDVVRQVNAYETSRSASEQISGKSILQQAVGTEENVPFVRKTCKYCERSHGPNQECPARDKTCSVCGKRGHFHAVCYSRNRNNSPANKSVNRT